MNYSHVGNSPLETILYINIRRFPSFRDVTIVQNFTCDWSGVVRMPHVSNVCICLRERAHRVNLKSYFINARRRPFHKWAFHLQCRVINCYLMDGAHALTALSTVRVRSLARYLCVYQERLGVIHLKELLRLDFIGERWIRPVGKFVLDSISESPDSLIFLLRKTNLIGFSFRVSEALELLVQAWVYLIMEFIWFTVGSQAICHLSGKESFMYNLHYAYNNTMSNETGWITPHFGLSNHTNCEDSPEMISNSAEICQDTICNWMSKRFQCELQYLKNIKIIKNNSKTKLSGLCLKLN